MTGTIVDTTEGQRAAAPWQIGAGANGLTLSNKLNSEKQTVES